MSGNPTSQVMTRIMIDFCHTMSNSARLGRLRTIIDEHTLSVLVIVLVGIIAGIKLLFWWGAQPSPRPKNMPLDSIWIDAPAVPFGWHRGWWFGCWIDSDGHSNRCRFFDGETPQVVYEGLYVSCDSGSPVPANELKIKAPVESMHMWVGLNQNGDIAPAAFLQNGEFLVPVRSPHGCEELKKNLALEH